MIWRLKIERFYIKIEGDLSKELLFDIKIERFGVNLPIQTYE